MSRRLAPRAAALPGSVFSSLLARFGAYEGDRYPLHLGDTWRPPAVSSAQGADRAAVHRYAPVPGLTPLRDAVARRVAQRTGVPVARDEVAITAGATGGLACVVGALVGEGDEVLLLAPTWPLVAGQIRAWGGQPVHVPCFGEDQSADDLVAALDAAFTDRTVAVYVNTPNNPTGLVLDDARLEAVVAWARARDVWILADEVYDLYAFEGGHRYVRSLAPERTVSVWSCSKAYGMAGFRVGWVVGPSEVVGPATRMQTYVQYCAPRPAQEAALAVLEGAGDAWAADAAAQYAQVGRDVAERLGVAPPEGSTFLFVDLAPWVGDTSADEVLAACVARGVLLAPGAIFGPYPQHVRLCFTAVDPDATRAGVEVFAEVVGA